MAYRRSKGKMTRSRKIEPAVKTLSFFVVVPANTTSDMYIDLSQCASLVNRRFYRQGLNWAVQGMKVLSTPNASTLDGSITVSKLPETWVMSNAWEKAYHAYRKMNEIALEESESVRPRFEDFKIYADATHHALGYAGNMLPLGVAGAAVPGEWESSKLLLPVTGPATTTPGVTFERELIAVGANFPGNSPVTGLNAVSLIEGYANSRALPNILDPNVPDDAQHSDGGAPENWLGALFNDGSAQDADVLSVLTSENNLAPYPFENDGVHVDTMYPNGETQLTGLQIHDVEYVTGTTVGGTSRLKGGLFPCGLINLKMINNNTEAGQTVSHTITIDLVPGTHRGYLCQPMQDM